MPPRARKTYDAKHRAPDQPGDTVNSRGEARRAPSPRHSEPSEPRKRSPRSRPVSATPVTAPIRPRPTSGGNPRRQAAAAEAARDYSQRQAIRSGTAKPSVVGGATAGGLGGAAAGAAIGGPPGAAVGGALGAVGGGVGGARAKKAYKAAMRSNGQARKVIVAEFAVCIVIAALSPLTDRKRDEKPGAFMKRMSAIMALFLILALVSAMGRTASRISAGLGGLITVGLVVSERDLFIQLARIFGSANDKPAAGTGPDDEDLGAIGAIGGGIPVGGIDVGETAGDVLGQIPGL